jgi:acyl-CoA synthetase (AMP-forming)/AMP-acid ligase II
LLSGASTRFDLRSLEVITFGAEVMPASTLERLARTFPSVRLVQKYGSTEFGALRGRSRADGALWLESSDAQQLRVVDGLLQVKTSTALLGYLNAESPVAADGWLHTGDLVQQDGDYLRILGRASELINVGGEKVFPSEIEATLLELPFVQDALAFGEPNALMGQVVSVELVYTGPARGAELSALVRKHCAARLARHKVPMRVEVVPSLSMSAQKKRRNRAGGPAGDAR